MILFHHLDLSSVVFDQRGIVFLLSPVNVMVSSGFLFMVFIRLRKSFFFPLLKLLFNQKSVGLHQMPFKSVEIIV